MTKTGVVLHLRFLENKIINFMDTYDNLTETFKLKFDTLYDGIHIKRLELMKLSEVGYNKNPKIWVNLYLDFKKEVDKLILK